MSDQLEIVIRPMLEEDTNFILSTWLKSNRKSQSVRGVDSLIYYEKHQELIKKLLASCDVQIACDINNERVLYGYSVSSENILHYIYVKAPFRQLGIAKELKSSLSLNWKTTLGPLPSYLSHLVYNPYLLSN